MQAAVLISCCNIGPRQRHGIGGHHLHLMDNTDSCTTVFTASQVLTVKACGSLCRIAKAAEFCTPLLGITAVRGCRASSAVLSSAHQVSASIWHYILLTGGGHEKRACIFAKQYCGGRQMEPMTWEPCKNNGCNICIHSFITFRVCFGAQQQWCRVPERTTAAVVALTWV